MERRLYLSKETTDESDDEQNDPRDESIEPQHTNMHTDENEENLPLVDFSNQNATPLPAFRTAFRSWFSALTDENSFHVSNSVSSSDIQSRISDAQFEEAASFSPTSGIRQRAVGVESNEIAPDSTNLNVPDYTETVSSGLCEQHNRDVSTSFSHAATNQVSNPDILLNDEIRLPQSLEQSNTEPIFYRTDTNTQTLDGNFSSNCHILDMLREQSITLVDHIVHDDDKECKSDKAAEAPSCVTDYDPLEGPSTRNTGVSAKESINSLSQNEFCEGVGVDGGLNQHSLSGDDPFDGACRNDEEDSDYTEDTSAMNVQEPLLNDTVDKPIVCKFCNKRFSHPEELIIHYRTHSGKKPYECEKCGKRFTNRGNLENHSRIHTGEKPYACETCGKRFTINGNLKKHSRIHKGEKPYACETCGKRFTQKGNLDDHILTHSGKKPFECEKCGKRFTRKADLKKHILTHSGKKPYKCEICGKRFSTKSNLNQHTRTHSGDKSAK